MPAVARFNQRLREGGRGEEQISLRIGLPGEARYRPPGFPVYRRMMIAEDGREVRAAVVLYHNNIFIHGKKRDCCWLDMPISEGIIDRRYSLAIIQLIKAASRYEPFLMSTGAGPENKDSFRLLTGLYWTHRVVPFFFYPVKVTKVLLGMSYFKKHAKLRYGALLGAYSGAGAAMSGLLALRRRCAAGLSGYEYSIEKAFDDWADRIFEDSLPDYGVAMRSDATTLNILHPPDKPSLTRLRVRRKGAKNGAGQDVGQDAGWILVASKRMKNNHHFGDLKVGTLVDGFGRAADAPALVAAGIDHLAETGADIIVANFSHAAWVRACRRSGMFAGPDSYYHFVSPGGSPLFEDTCPPREIHMTRGHSDGMWSLV
ncbi:MAG TPA: hypothetical protein VG324_28645 [Blastocatellia bacterium]|nr:hypothetical protein [Blastocatellia bacterium]